MEIITTEIKDLLLFKPRLFSDSRGYFYESYNRNVFTDNHLQYRFVQDNESSSTYGVLRGLHFQYGAMAQAKLVRVSQGEVLDVVVDLRKDSPTFGQSFSIKLNSENKLQLLIPRFFAHGFVVLSEFAVFQYKCDNFYSQTHESGIRWNDPSLNIDWIIPSDDIIVSKKDTELPFLNELNIHL